MKGLIFTHIFLSQAHLLHVRKNDFLLHSMFSQRCIIKTFHSHRAGENISTHSFNYVFKMLRIYSFNFCLSSALVTQTPEESGQIRLSATNTDVIYESLTKLFIKVTLCHHVTDEDNSDTLTLA